MANPFPPPFYSIGKSAARRANNALKISKIVNSTAASQGLYTPRGSGDILVAIGKTRGGLRFQPLPRPLGNT